MAILEMWQSLDPGIIEKQEKMETRMTAHFGSNAAAVGN
jgi:hypothetical protein